MFRPALASRWEDLRELASFHLPLDQVDEFQGFAEQCRTECSDISSQRSRGGNVQNFFGCPATANQDSSQEQSQLSSQGTCVDVGFVEDKDSQRIAEEDCVLDRKSTRLNSSH